MMGEIYYDAIIIVKTKRNGEGMKRTNIFIA
jgi:hypothetical protein